MYEILKKVIILSIISLITKTITNIETEEEKIIINLLVIMLFIVLCVGNNWH